MLQEMERECIRLTDDAAASAAKAAQLSADNVKLHQVRLPAAITASRSDALMCLLAQCPHRAEILFMQELNYVKNEMSKLATAASTKDSALHRKDAQVLVTAASPVACAGSSCNISESSPYALLALQIEALQEDKRAVEQVLTQCREQLERLRTDYATSAVSCPVVCQATMECALPNDH